MVAKNCYNSEILARGHGDRDGLPRRGRHPRRRSPPQTGAAGAILIPEPGLKHYYLLSRDILVLP
ncbi:hypothetical protein [Oxynema aestuarii]|uniref:Uncharacterized protein n=1 Tax=Oxynema aestuarii AP17 TaxID=2064643 RepID=A0A6H1TYA6_9CYAN|nr:hypothetical protein [Oxynema aestuarii]QIZ70900.1 hypothetical protein HCG48_10130 [Oxynema aestuarii AP17]